MPDIAITLTQAEPEINLTLLNGADVRTYLDSLSEYTSDQAAIDDGLSVGDWYVCADGHESAASGTLKKIR
jgi:hypothetical protein